MKYKIYGDDFFHKPFVRRLDLPEDPGVSDVLQHVRKFWNTVQFHKAEDKLNELFLAKDKNECLSLFMQKKEGAAIRRIGTLLPETHPVYNFDIMLKTAHKMITARISPVFHNVKYLLDNTSDYV